MQGLTVAVTSGSHNHENQVEEVLVKSTAKTTQVINLGDLNPLPKEGLEVAPVIELNPLLKIVAPHSPLLSDAMPGG